MKMAEMVASRSLQMLDYLADKDEDARGLVEDEVKELVLALRKTENLLNNGHNRRKVLDNMETIRNLAYTIEDALETWVVELEVAFMPRKNEKKTGVRMLFRKIFGRQDDGMAIFFVAWILVKKLFLVGHMIRWLHDTFPEDVLESERSVVIERRVANRRSLRWPRQMNAHGMEEHFVEMKEDLTRLLSLVAEDKEHPVVSIWGVKGLGKTNLARKVYIHPQVRTRFNAFAWVSLNQDDQIGNILQNMLKQLGAGAVKKIAEEQKKGAAEEKKKGVEEKKKGAEEQQKSSKDNMIDQLKETQRQKSCFIVIDGILGISQWEDIRSAFLMEGTDTKFLLTTDVETIADMGLPYKLRFLNEDEGWELLQKYAFRGKQAPDLGIVPKLGKEMVQKCGGLPSAISSLGRTLSSAKSLSEWHEVNDNVTRYLEMDYQSESNERSNDALDPSYDHLPYYLKQCFLYLAIFKEDEDVDPEDLSFLWMAEGMEKDKEGTIMDTAENYLRELAFKSMLQVQVDELSANRRFMPLSLHNHARELSLYQGEKEDFRLKVVDFSGGKKPRFDPYTLSDGTRRLSIHFNKLSSPREHDLYATEDLRSLFFLNSDQEYVHLPVRIPKFKEFTLLRVLHFVRCKFEGRKLPEGIDELVNLRYFGLLYCDLDRLPPSISNVRNLHVLNVRAYDDAKITIPNVISQMVRLKHLRLPNKLDHEQSDKLKLDGLLDLETLVGFNVDIHDLDSLSNLKKLRHLATHAYSNDCLKSIIDKLSKLVKSDGTRIQTNLFIEHNCNFTSPDGSTILEEMLMCPNLDALTFSMVLIHKFPNCGIYASSDISQIKLIGCKLGEDPMKALGMFPNLQKLCLGYGAFVGRNMAIYVGGFPKLEYLEFRCLPNLEEWRVDEGAMKKLSTLTVRRCPKLKGIPEGLASVSSLKNLEIELPPSALDQGQEEIYHQKFAFVTSRHIRKLDPLSAGNDSAH